MSWIIPREPTVCLPDLVHDTFRSILASPRVGVRASITVVLVSNVVLVVATRQPRVHHSPGLHYPGRSMVALVLSSVSVDLTCVPHLTATANATQTGPALETAGPRS